MPPKHTKAQAKKSPSAIASGAAGKRKKLSFDESTLKAASSEIQTTHIDTTAKPQDGKKPRRQQKGKPVSKSAASTTARKRAAADMQGSGIVKAQRAKTRAAAVDEDQEEEEEEMGIAPVHSDDDSSDDEADMLNGVDAEDNLSDVAGRASSSDDEDDDDAAARKKNGKGYAVAPYRAVRLSFLPREFQEPQLYKFLNQFGATVLNCFCVRSKRSHRSKGIAYVEFDKESVIPLVVEECNGMALGGMSVQARPVTMHRPMPSRKLVTRRRALAYAYRTQGVPLKKHDVSKKNAVALLIKAARTEKANNAHLRQLGIDFQTNFFQSQLKTMPAGLFHRKDKKKTVQTAAAPKEARKTVAKKAPRTAVKKVVPKKTASTRKYGK